MILLWIYINYVYNERFTKPDMNDDAWRVIENVSTNMAPSMNSGDICASIKLVKSTRKPSNNLRFTLKLVKSDTIRYDSYMYIHLIKNIVEKWSEFCDLSRPALSPPDPMLTRMLPWSRKTVREFWINSFFIRNNLFLIL